MIVSSRVLEYYHTRSAARRMFELGLQLKQQHGADQVADLSIGNPNFDPPRAFTEAIADLGVRGTDHAYMPNAGYPYIRQRVADYLNRHGFFEGIAGNQVVMTTGAAGALNVVLKTILEPGDEILAPLPYFGEYLFYVENHGGVVVPVGTHPDFSLDVEAIDEAITARTRAILVNSPNNPTGRVYAPEVLDALAQVLRRHSRRLGHPIFLISDEPYRDILYDGCTFISPASLYENSFMCFSWSKSFSIAGERIGYIALNPRMEVDDWDLLIGVLGMCNRFLGFVNAPAFMQHVLGASIDAPVDVKHYAMKRARLCDALDEGGYEYARAEGTFYLFPRTPEPEADFIQHATENLLLVVPGSSFGLPDHFRISFAASDHVVDLACHKLLQLAHHVEVA